MLLDLEEDEARPRREKLRLTRIHDLLLREGFDGSYDAVRCYAARWRQARRRDVMNAPVFIPLLFRSGEAYQFDCSHEDVEIAGKPMRVKVAHGRPFAHPRRHIRCEGLLPVAGHSQNIHSTGFGKAGAFSFLDPMRDILGCHSGPNRTGHQRRIFQQPRTVLTPLRTPTPDCERFR